MNSEKTVNMHTDIDVARYLLATENAKHMFLALREAMSPYGQVDMTVHCGIYTNNDNLLAAMYNLCIPLDCVRNNEGIGSIVLTVDNRICPTYRYDRENRVLVFDMAHNGKHVKVQIPPILIMGMCVRDYPSTRVSVSNYGINEFISVAGDMAITKCPETIYKRTLIKGQKNLPDNVVSIFNK
jgi:hypothetical protein